MVGGQEDSGRRTGEQEDRRTVVGGQEDRRTVVGGQEDSGRRTGGQSLSVSLGCVLLYELLSDSRSSQWYSQWLSVDQGAVDCCALIPLSFC